MIGREEAIELHATYSSIVRKIEEGSMPANIPWGDPRFQGMVIAALNRSGKNASAAGEFDAFKRNLREVMGPK